VSQPRRRRTRDLSWWSWAEHGPRTSSVRETSGPNRWAVRHGLRAGPPTALPTSGTAEPQGQAPRGSPRSSRAGRDPEGSRGCSMAPLVVPSRSAACEVDGDWCRIDLHEGRLAADGDRSGSWLNLGPFRAFAGVPNGPIAAGLSARCAGPASSSDVDTGLSRWPRRRVWRRMMLAPGSCGPVGHAESGSRRAEGHHVGGPWVRLRSRPQSSR
jgi:hypothetical protein